MHPPNPNQRVVVPVPTVPIDNMDRQLQLACMAYGIQYKADMPLNVRFKGLMQPVPSNRFNDADLRSDLVLLNKVSKEFSLSGAPALSWDDKQQIKHILEEFAFDIAMIIFAPKDVFHLTRRCLEFIKQWNTELDAINGEFLPGFGDIYAAELYILDSQALICFLAKLQQALEIPEPLAIFKGKLIQKAITTSIRNYEFLNGGAWQMKVARKVVMKD